MTTTTERHLCGVLTRSGQPCRSMTTGVVCQVHDPERTCGAPNGRGGTCRRIVTEPGRRCELHDEHAIERRRAATVQRRDSSDRQRRAAHIAEHARDVEIDALLAALNGCPHCSPLVLRAVLHVEVEGDPFEDDAPPTPLSVAWPLVVEHLRAGHELVAR